MRDKIYLLTGFFCSVLMAFGVSAGAQIAETTNEVSLGPGQGQGIIGNIEQNPFDTIRDIAEIAEVRGNQSPILQKQNNRLSTSTSKMATKNTGALKYRRKFNGSEAQLQSLYKTLVQQYGEPLSVRGQSHVWDIKNPTRGGEQADIVTVILKTTPNGSYELIMDRDRGEDGRATWDAPRIEPVPAKKQQKQVKKFQPILQPDND